jgi:hypothetical protein
MAGAGGLTGPSCWPNLGTAPPFGAVLVRPGEQGRLRLSCGPNHGPSGPIREGPIPSSTQLAGSSSLLGPA